MASNKQKKLLHVLDVAETDKLPRILADNKLNALKPDKTPLLNVHALGDAADIKKDFLPNTADVAVQKVEYPAKLLNTDSDRQHPFKYQQRALVAYIGGHDGVVQGRPDWSGPRAWAA